MDIKEKELYYGIKHEAVQSCPACGSDGFIALESCRDHICGLPGTWSFRKCNKCYSLWIDPRPTREMIPSLYTEKYSFTHNQPETPLQEPKEFLAKLRFVAKLASLERIFGYEQRKVNTLPLETKLGTFISYLPGISQRAGYSIRYLHHRPHGRLLEVGVGNGSFLWLMNELGWEVEGIEPDPQAAQMAAATGLNIIQSGVEDANLKPSSYDAIVMHHVLEHLPNPKEALIKLIASLKPGGTLVSISPNPVGMGASLFASNWYGLADTPRHLVLPSPRGYQYMLEGTGTKVKISTTMQIAFWMYRESLSLQKTGHTGNYQGSFLPTLTSILGSLLLPAFQNIGEEVICYATKL